MMKKIMLLLLLQVTALMAITYNVTREGQMIPVTEDQSPTTETATSTPTVATPTPAPTTPTEQTAGSAKTNWGFQGFTVPNNSVTVNAGENIQAAINKLETLGGGTLHLNAGTHKASALDLCENLVIEGAGIGKTIFEYYDNDGANAVDDDRYLIRVRGSEHGGTYRNFIMRNLTLSDHYSSFYPVTFTSGAENILFENMDLIYGGSLKVNNGKHVTFKNIDASGGAFQIFDVVSVDGVIIDNVEQKEATTQGIDLARCNYVEISNLTYDNSSGSVSNAIKWPGADHVYMHDSLLVSKAGSDNIGIRLDTGSTDITNRHVHLENINITGWVRAVYHATSGSTPSHKELVLKNVNISGTTKNPDEVETRGVVNLYKFSDCSIPDGIDNKAGSITNYYTPDATKNTPASLGVGYTSWGNP
jgi:hypothetical protein